MSYTSKDYLNRISECICEYLNKHDVTIKDFASLCGISYTLMRRICNRQSSGIYLITLIKIADCMDVPLEYLITIDRQKTKEEILLHDMYIKLKAYNEYQM